MSSGVLSALSLKVTTPVLAIMSSARLSFVGSFGTAMLTPSLTFVKLLCLREYTPIGSK